MLTKNDGSFIPVKDTHTAKIGELAWVKGSFLFDPAGQLIGEVLNAYIRPIFTL